MPTYKKLSPQEEEEIRVLYRMGGWSYDKLAVKFGSSKSTIKRVIKRGTPPKKAPIQIVREEPQRETTSPLETLESFTADPILFRIQKLQEITMDTQALAVRGVNPAALYKLQIELHDQITQMRREAGELQGEENEEQLLMMVEQAVMSMSPIQRESILSLLGDEFDNVVGMKK